jgi:hypothetical protein
MKKWTVRILLEQFAKSQEPSDLAEKKVHYRELSSSVSSEEIRPVGSKSARAIGSLAKSHFGVS